MIYINLDQPYEEAVARLKQFHAVKGNQAMIENLVRDEAMRLGLWPQQAAITAMQQATSHDAQANAA